MSNNHPKIPFAKKDQREVTTFFGHELLYDYLCGNLDKQRRSAVEDYVKFSRDAQLDLTKIKDGQNYAEKLAQTIVSQPIITQINYPNNYFNLLMQKAHFEKWPPGLKWGLEVLVVVFAIVSVLSITPWEKVIKIGSLGSKDVILAVVPKEDAVKVAEEKPLYVDEGIKEKDIAKPVIPNPVPVATAEPTPIAIATVDKKSIKGQGQSVAEPTGNGFLYRGEISVSNLDAAQEKITQKISELGGRKAGSVTLGWKKTPDSSYYHFTIPEAKYTELASFLSTYGKLRIGKEKHFRVMPDGIIRLIITVDEAKK